MHPRYKRAAAIYDRAFPVFSLGAGPRIHKILARAVALEPGATVVDLGCGTGLMLPLLRERVGPGGRVIGVDMTEPMLDKAREKVAMAGWTNVELHCGDMTEFDPGVPVDGVVFALSMSAAEPEKVFHRTLQYLRPGARMVIADGLPASGRWYHPAVNAYSRVRAPLVGSDMERAAQISRLAQANLVELRRRLLLGGLYTIISGRAPGPRR